MTPNRRSSVIRQAGVLAAAGIISRIIGLLYRSPLNSIIGEEGLGYYQAAYAMYTIVLLISSYSIPSAISRIIAQKLALREYENAHRIFKCAMWYVLAVGGAASLFLFFGAGLMVDGVAVTVLRVFAPTIFLYGVLGVLRGYFQAHKSMVQTSVSQILEQVANAIVSIGAAYLLIRSMMGTMEVPASGELATKRAMFGAIGSALGTGAGVLVGLLFMAGVYGLNVGLVHRRIRREQQGRVRAGTGGKGRLDSYGEISRSILTVVTPFILNTAIYNLSTPLNSKLYTVLFLKVKNIDVGSVYSNYGIYSGQSMTIANIPIAFASAMAAAMIPSIAQLMAAGDYEGARNRNGQAVKATMLISIPSAVGLLVAAEPITRLLFNRSDEVVALSSGLLRALSLSVVFFALSTLSSSILQGMGRINTPVVNSAIALAIQTLVLVALLLFTNMNLYAIAVANTVYAMIVSVLNQLAVRRAIRYRQELVRTFLLPTVASAVMGAVVYGCYKVLGLVISSDRLAILPAIGVGGMVYFVMLLVLRVVNERELAGFPKGHLLVKAARRLRLL